MTAFAPPRSATTAAPPDLAPSRLAGLTAIRGIAVVAVVIFHTTEIGWHWLPGGWAGVDVFFVLSGYLVERVLCGDRGGRRVRRFYLRRWARLGPALGLAVGAAVLVAATMPARAAWSTSSLLPVVRPSPVTDVLRAAGQTVVGLGNLDLAHGHVGAPSLGHLWSLSIEAQVYLMWPVLFFVARTRQVRMGLLLTATTVSVLAPLHAYHGAGDRAAVYFATPTHLVGFALGALCYELDLGHRITGWRRDALLVSSGGALVAIFCWLGEGSLKYQSGSALTAVAGCGLLIASVGRDARLAGRRTVLLRWFGDRSYGLYLWHFPIIAWLAVDPGWSRVVGVAVAVVLADLSFRYVERPATEWARRRERGRHL